MKVKVFGVLLLSVLVCFMACKPKEEPVVQITGITVTPSELFMDLKDTYRLSYALTPAGATGEVKWSSTDSTVAYVAANGLVTANNYGNCMIIATCFGVSDTCLVKVKTFLENREFNNALLWSVDTTYAKGRVDTIYVSKIHTLANTYYVYLSMATMYVMSKGLYVNESGYFDGTTKGTIIKFQAPMYSATKALNPHHGDATNFSLGGWSITDNSEYWETEHIGKAGTIHTSTYLEYMKKWVAGYNAAQTSDELSAAYTYLDSADMQLENAVFYTLTYHSTEEGYSVDGYYSPKIKDGVVTSGYLYTDTTKAAPSKYMVGLSYSEFICYPLDNINNIWGCNLKMTTSTTGYSGYKFSWADNSLHMYDVIHYTYGEMPEEKVPAIVPVKAPVLRDEYPEVAARLKSQLRRDCRMHTVRVK